MTRGLKGAVAAFAATASFAAVAVAPAGATELDGRTPIEPVLPECIRQPTVPTCVNYAIDVVDRQVTAVERAYAGTVRPYLCDVQWILDGQGCVQ